MFARLTWIVGIWKARSLVAVVTLDMSLDEQHWRLCWFHTNYLFSTICFRHDWLHLKVDISSFLCIYFSCLLRQVFVEIQLVLLCLWRDLTKRTIYLLYFTKSHCFSTLCSFKWYLILICTIKNVVFLVIFSHHKKNATSAVFDPRGLHCSSKWQHGKNRLCVEMMSALFQTHCRTSTINMGAEQNIRRIHTLNRMREPGVRYRKAVQQM